MLSKVIKEMTSLTFTTSTSHRRPLWLQPQTPVADPTAASILAALSPNQPVVV